MEECLFCFFWFLLHTCQGTFKLEDVEADYNIHLVDFPGLFLVHQSFQILLTPAPEDEWEGIGVNKDRNG